MFLSAKIEASAGHNPAYVYRGETGEVAEICSNNLIAGAFPLVSFRSERIELHPSDMMLVYSDGLTEAENERGEMLGEDLVRRALRQHAADGADSVKEALLDLLNGFTGGHKQNDDITLFILEKT